MKVKVTFEDIIEVEDLQHAYTVVTEYCNHVANFEDVTAFNFEPLPDEDWIKTPVTRWLSASYRAGAAAGP